MFEPIILCLNISSRLLLLLSGEGKLPTNLMMEPNYDLDAFPTFHPSGKNGLNQKRDKKISDQDYFCQRILNKDQRFRNSKKYLFSAVYRIERKQLESQIRMSFRKGFVNNNNLLRIEDGFHMFDKIPGKVTRFRQI